MDQNARTPTTRRRAQPCSTLGSKSGCQASGVRLVALTATTIRGVALGVVGVAVIQSLLIGIPFFAIGFPAAGILTLATLLLGIVQVPATLVTLVTLPVIVLARRA